MKRDEGHLVCPHRPATEVVAADTALPRLVDQCL